MMMMMKRRCAMVLVLVHLLLGDTLTAEEFPRKVVDDVPVAVRTKVPAAVPRVPNSVRLAAVASSGQSSEPTTSSEPTESSESTTSAETTESVESATSAETSRAALRLPPPKAPRSALGVGRMTDKSPRWVAGRVGVVLALFFGLMLVQRLFARRTAPSLPNGMIHVCGKVPLDAKQSLHLVRIGQRLLVLLESPQGMQRIAEITDPLEVRRLLESDTQPPRDLGSLDVSQVLSRFRQNESSVA